jgi:lysozyme family protein
MSFDTLVADVIKREGGFVDDPRDSGGATKYGVTERLARAYNYIGDMRDMTETAAKMIYRSAFWDYMHLDDVEFMMPTVAEELFDTAVNQGTTAAGTYLQRALNVFNQNGKMYADNTVDGHIGPMTIAALREFIRSRPTDGELVMLRALNALQGAFYIELAEKREKDEAFVFGWLKNRVS